MDNQSKSIIV